MLLRTSMFADKFAIKLFFHSTRRENGDWVYEPGAGFFFPASNKSEKVKPDNGNGNNDNLEDNETGLIANFLSELDKEVVFQYNSSGLLNDSPEKTDIPRTYKIGLIGSYRF